MCVCYSGCIFLCFPINVDIGGAGSFFGLRSVCSRVEFLGFQAAYKDVEAAALGYNEKEGDAREESFEILCKLKTGDSLHLSKVELKQHSTQPPSHYSEASLVKKMEELGIGRPSTYASTIKVLQDRHYVTVKNRALHPEFRGRMVSAFLSHHFSEVTDYSFTADMETELDNVSAGTTEWKGLLKDYWTRFKTYCDLAGKVDIRQVEKMLEKTFGNFIFASLPNKSRTCPSCLTGTLTFKVSRFGAGYFIGCDQHPEC
ncbi:Dna topoisomerase, partial [Thalictrum thalictroides]